MARLSSALSSAAMIIDWSSTRSRCPTAPVVGLTASKKPSGPARATGLAVHGYSQVS
jgi:hypothetical protein